MELTMNRSLAIALFGLAASPAFAVGRLADVSIVDRDTGKTLTAHLYRGEYWVAGRPGARYAVNVRSQHHGRVLAVTSVDGINVITGGNAAFNQTGYIYDPWQGYDIAGWRKSSQEIAAFTFTSIPRSYAARTGRPQNVGIIGVALFRERPEPMVAQPMYEQSAVADAGASAPSASENRSARSKSTEGLGTGHGRREFSEVRHVDFEREQSQPNEIIRIRYDSYDNLVALGVIRRTPTPRYAPQPFPEEPGLGYVPDP
jgi:hypothetical protein